MREQRRRLGKTQHCIFSEPGLPLFFNQNYDPFVQVCKGRKERLQDVSTKGISRDTRRSMKGPALISWASLTAHSLWFDVFRWLTRKTVVLMFGEFSLGKYLF